MIMKCSVPTLPTASQMSLLILCINTAVASGETIAYWRMNGTPDAVASTVVDSSGHSLDGIAFGSPTYRADVAADPIPQTGASNPTSLRFGEVQQNGVLVPDNPLFELTQSLTVEAFIKPRPELPIYDWGHILMRGDDRGGLDPYFLAIDKLGRLTFQIDSLTDSVSIRASLPAFDQWLHVAGTLDDSTGLLALYINGQLATSTTTNVRPFGPLDVTYHRGIGLGQEQGNSLVQGFHGWIDEVRLSNSALQPGQFLNAAVPEPSSFALGVFALMGVAGYGLMRFRSGRSINY